MRDIYSAGRAVERGAWGTPDGIDADRRQAGGPELDAPPADPPALADALLAAADAVGPAQDDVTVLVVRSG